jgi:small subunit ribosomal protein S24e
MCAEGGIEMEVINRLDNPLLNRVEIEFKVTHTNTATPSRGAMRSAIASLEPGASAETVVVKEVSTRFGQPQTTGLAFIYDSVESMQNEPNYILKRHGAGGEEAAEAKPAPAPAAAPKAAEEPAEEPAEPEASAEPAEPAEPEEAADVSGGEE